MPCHEIPATSPADNIAEGDYFQFAADASQMPILWAVRWIEGDRINFSSPGYGEFWATYDEFRELGPYCSITAMTGYLIEWARVNGLSPEECAAMLDRRSRSRQ